MRFLILSDIHGNIEYLEKLSEEFEKADAVLVAGDFAEFNRPETGLPVLQFLLKKHERLFCVTGNCDEIAFIDELESHDVCVQSAVIFSEGLVFSGSGGSLAFTGVTPFERSDDELMQDLRLVSAEHAPDNLIVLIHQPPFDTKLDKISAGAHVGSKAVREFIQKQQPLLSVSGHIHESFSVDKIDKSTLVNPGSLAEGRYATAILEKTDAGWCVANVELKQL
ncbi:MAG: metallophosphoesterase family protein [Spirochaetales bacterium]